MVPDFNFNQNRFLSALALENSFSANKRRRFGKVTSVCLFFTLVFIAAGYLSAEITKNYGINNSALNNLIYLFRGDAWVGLFFILLAFRLFIFSLDAFFRSKTLGKNGFPSSENIAKRLNFRSSEIWHECVFNKDESERNLLPGILKTDIGKLILIRSGIYPEEFRALTSKKASDLKIADEVIFELEKITKDEKGINSADLFSALYNCDKLFREFLAFKKISSHDLQSAAMWAEEELDEADMKSRWWLIENLFRVGGLAKDWAYGEAYFLENFAQELRPSKIRKEELIGREREIGLLESALLKKSGANVLIVGETGAGKHALLFGLINMIHEGSVFPELEHKRVFELHSDTITASGKSKAGVEEILIKTLNEAVRAGNIILVIDNFPEFVESLALMGVSPLEIFSTYFENSNIHLLAMAEIGAFRKSLQASTDLMKYFEKIEIEEPREDKLILILKDLAPRFEAIYGGGAFFTSGSIREIAEAGERYLIGSALPKRAVNLMENCIKDAINSKIPLINEEFVSEVVSKITKIPLGRIDAAERIKLLSLDALLEKRVIGQKEATDAIAESIKRSRSGITNPKRPIGTFLFLGPTGVGKTETAKALSESYFGNEEAMIRLDMSEFQTEESIERLIGSFEKNAPGILSSKMLSSPYSVLLLDEFEKSNLKIRNLFLQILDEGFFSDYLGRKINMRNTIIIATSNAGSEMISELVAGGADSSKMKDEILAYVRKNGIYSPELLNRFDSLIIFRPLGKDTTTGIAKKMLDGLVSRLKKQNYILEIGEALVKIVSANGFDPAMGARPMQRYIQNKVEKIISDKIIRGEIRQEIPFRITAEEISAEAQNQTEKINPAPARDTLNHAEKIEISKKELKT